MRVVRHAAVKVLEVGKLVAIVDVGAGTVVKALGLIEFARKAVVGGRLKRSDVLGPVGKGTGGNTVVDGGAVAAEPLVVELLGLEEVTGGGVKSFVPEWDRTGVIALTLHDELMGVEHPSVPGEKLAL